MTISRVAINDNPSHGYLNTEKKKKEIGWILIFHPVTHTCVAFVLYNSPTIEKSFLGSMDVSRKSVRHYSFFSFNPLWWRIWRIKFSSSKESLRVFIFRFFFLFLTRFLLSLFFFTRVRFERTSLFYLSLGIFLEVEFFKI